MLTRIYMKAMQYRAFWQMRAAWLNAAFWVARTSYILRSRNRLKAEETNTFREFITHTQYSILRAVAAGFFLHFAGYVLGLRFPWLNLPEDKNGTYSTLLVAVASICGVFIALYYTAIATVGASIYSVVPNDIRHLLHTDRAGNVYLRFLSFLAFLCIFLVTAHLWGLETSWLALGVVSLCSGFGVFAFVVLGQHAFNLFDPTKLAGSVFRNMEKHLASATLEGYRWWDPSFQTAARQRMERQLRMLQVLSDYVASKPNLRVGSYPELATRSVEFLADYQHVKGSIPADSAWYEPRPIHRDWYRANYNEVQVAVTTGTALSFTENRDPLWVERRMLPILYRYMSCLVGQGNFDDLGEMHALVDRYMRVLFKDGEIARGTQVLEEMGESVFKTIRAVPAADAAKFETILKVLGVAELLGALPVASIVNYREALPSFQADSIGSKVAGIHWSNRASIYRAGLPVRLLQQAEWVAPRLSFERAVYGRDITPSWYIVDLFMAQESEHLVENGKVLTNRIPALYKSWKGLAKTLTTPWAYMLILSREWEYVHKLQHFLEVYKQHSEQAVAARKATSLKWSNVAIEKLEKRQQAHWRDVQIQMAACAKEYSILQRPESYPDCVGQFMHATADGILDALKANDLDLLKELFPAYREACIARYALFIDPARIKDIEALQYELKSAGSIILDLVDLSGYAKLLSEYHMNPGLWKVVTDDWDSYFSGADHEKRIKFIGAVLKATDNQLGLSHRAILRTNWEISVRRFLDQLPRHDEYPEQTRGMGLLMPEEIIEHDSPLVRLMAKEAQSMSLEGIDIFGAFYLEPQFAAMGVEVPREYTDLKDMVEGESEASGQGRRGRRRRPKGKET